MEQRGLRDILAEEIEREFDGQKLKYLVLHPLEKKTETVYVPVGNEKAMRKLRSILSEEEAETLIDALPQERPDGSKTTGNGKKSIATHCCSAAAARYSPWQVLYLHRGRAARARQEAACV